MWRALFDAEVEFNTFAAECGEAMAWVFSMAADNALRYMNGELSSDDEAIQAGLQAAAARHAAAAALPTPAPHTASPSRRLPPSTTSPLVVHDLDANGYPYGMLQSACSRHAHTTLRHSLSARGPIR